MKLADLEEAINEKRDEMIRMGMTKGLSSDETVYCSQELDRLLNDYDDLLSKYENSTTLDLYDVYLDFLHKQILKLIWKPYSYLVPNKSKRIH
jgi:Spo0E like sporulation regulatory protein